MRVSLQKAYVLHVRPWQDTSAIVDFFTKDYGRVSCIAKGCRSNKSKIRGLLLPFIPLLVSFSGKTNLYTLGKIEAENIGCTMKNTALVSSFYLNELLSKLLQPHDAYPQLFAAYAETLAKISAEGTLEQWLRVFEKRLLAEIGYGISFQTDTAGELIDPTASYSYELNFGFVKKRLQTANCLSGESILALQREDLTLSKVLKETKWLMRSIFGHLLADNPLKTSDLLR